MPRRKKPKKNLTRLLKGCAPGSWVIVDAEWTRIIARGRRLSIALRRANETEPDRKGAMIFKVRDPNVTYVY